MEDKEISGPDALSIRVKSGQTSSGGPGVYIFFGGEGSAVAIIAAGGTDLYCHSEPPLASGKLCFIINFIGGAQGGRIFTGGRGPLVRPL